MLDLEIVNKILKFSTDTFGDRVVGYNVSDNSISITFDPTVKEAEKPKKKSPLEKFNSIGPVESSGENYHTWDKTNDSEAPVEVITD